MSLHRTALRVLAATVLAAVALPAVALAAPTRESKIKGKGTGEIRTNDADRGAATDLGITDIEGRIYKPSVFYMLARSEIAYAGIEAKQNFTDRIVRGALKRPF
jgi:hypothetical protein